jgi:multidrug efflux pump subunit AcrA (membrane-fusion protein)
MADALPPLRSDLIIEAVAPTEGDPAYDVSSPDLARTHRVTSQAYLALSMIDGRKDFVGWATAVQQMYPELDLTQLHHLASEVNTLGYFSMPAALPAAPGPLSGTPLIRDLAGGAVTGYDPNAATMPGSMLPPIAAPATDEMSPEQAMDLMFTAPSSEGSAIMPTSPSGPIAGAPAPVTAVNKHNPLLGQGPPGLPPGHSGELFLPDDPSDSLDMDVDVDFGATDPPSPPVGGDPWTAPPTPVPSLPGQAATAAPPPVMPGDGIDPFSMTDPAMAAQNTDSFPPLVASLPSGEGRGAIPKAWPNLAVDHTDSKDLVAVTGPEKGIPFQIYELEHRMLQLMDGTRDQATLLDDVRAMGHPIDEGQLMSFIRQMDAYGFLESTGPLQRKIERARMWAPKPPNDSLSKAPWPEEERRLFQVGLGHFRDGRTDKAVSFFEALLEINPENPEALSMLELIQGRRPAASALEPSGGVAPSPSPPAPGPVPGTAAPPVTNLASAGVTNLASVGVAGMEDIAVDAPAAAPKKKGGGLFRLVAGLIVVVVAAVVGGLYVEQPTATTVSAAVVPAPVTKVNAPIDGVVQTVTVKAGQSVAAGDVLATLGDGDVEALSEAARAIAVMETTLDEQPDPKLNKRKVSKALKKAKSALKKLEKQEAKLLKAKGSKSKSKAASAAKKLAKLQPKLTERRGEIDTLSEQKAQLEGALSKKDIAALKAQLDDKRQALAALQANTTTQPVKASAAGVVQAAPAPVAVGATVTKGQPLVHLMGAGASIALYVPEDVLELAPTGASVLVSFGTVNVPVEVVTFSPTFDTRDGVKVNAVQAKPKGALPPLPDNAAGQAVLEGPPKPLTIQGIEWLNRKYDLGLPVDF